MAGIAALAIAYVLSQFFRSFLAVLTPVLSTELGMTKGDLSLASGAYFIVFALAQFGIGVALDRVGPRRTAASILAIAGGGGAFLFAAAPTPWVVVAAMGLIGLGCAPVLMAALFIFAKIYPPARFAVLASWTLAFGTAGNVLGAAPLAYAEEIFGWRNVMAGLGVVTILVAVAVLVLVRDPARDADEERGGGLAGYMELFRMPLLWAIIPLMALSYAPALGIRGLWAGPYLAEAYGADALLIGRVTLFMALGMVAGAFAYGPLDTFFGTRKWVGVAGNTISLLALCFLALQPTPDLWLTVVVLVVIGVTGVSYGLLMAHARAFLPKHLVGRGVTLMNFFSIGGVGVMQFATGGVVTSYFVPGEPVAAYQALFVFYAVLIGFAVLVYLFSRDAKPERAGAASGGRPESAVGRRKAS